MLEKHHHNYLLNDPVIHRNEKRTLIVVILTALMMVVEVVYGYWTGSMALLADGWHMASHAAALGISYLAYRLAKSQKLTRHFSFGAGKMIPLGGYTSALLLAVIAFLMLWESGQRFFSPQTILFNEAIIVAVVGLVVNIVSAWILHGGADHHHHHDHNLKGAYLHVIADAFTSVLAIVALVVGKFWNQLWVDSLMGIVGSMVILKWSYGLTKETSWELLDGHAKALDREGIKNKIEATGAQVIDLHLWRVAPQAYACELTVKSTAQRGTSFYRDLILKEESIQHIIVEEFINSL